LTRLEQEGLVSCHRRDLSPAPYPHRPYGPPSLLCTWHPRAIFLGIMRPKRESHHKHLPQHLAQLPGYNTQKYNLNSLYGVGSCLQWHGRPIQFRAQYTNQSNVITRATKHKAKSKVATVTISVRERKGQFTSLYLMHSLFYHSIKLTGRWGGGAVACVKILNWNEQERGQRLSRNGRVALRTGYLLYLVRCGTSLSPCSV
jgi:hypothetical protein